MLIACYPWPLEPVNLKIQFPVKSNAYNMDFEENASKWVIFFMALQGSPTDRKKATAQLGCNGDNKERGFHALQAVGLARPVG